MSPYTQLFCIPQNSCLINLSEKTIRRKKIKATKDDVNYLTDKGITWEKEYICTTFITGTSSIQRKVFLPQQWALPPKLQRIWFQYIERGRKKVFYVDNPQLPKFSSTGLLVFPWRKQSIPQTLLFWCLNTKASSHNKLQSFKAMQTLFTQHDSKELTYITVNLIITLPAMVTSMQNLHKIFCVISQRSFLAGKMKMENINDSLSILLLTRLSNKQK